MKKVAMDTNWMCYSSRTKCMFHILQKVGAERERKVSVEGVLTVVSKYPTTYQLVVKLSV